MSVNDKAGGKPPAPLWKLPQWHWCRHYDGLGGHRWCRAMVRYEAVAVHVPLPSAGRPETLYPCCIEWGGPNNCPKREIEKPENSAKR